MLLIRKASYNLISKWLLKITKLSLNLQNFKSETYLI